MNRPVCHPYLTKSLPAPNVAASDALATASCRVQAAGGRRGRSAGGRSTGRRVQHGAGAQALGASQHAGAQQLFSQQGWQQASFAFSRSKR